MTPQLLLAKNAPPATVHLPLNLLPLPAPAKPTPNTIEAQFLGSLALQLNGKKLELNRQAKMMLGYLAHHFPKPVSREHLAKAFWPEKHDNRPVSARRSLNVEMNHIRTALRSLCPQPTDLVTFANNCYGIHHEVVVRSDAADFKARCKGIQSRLRAGLPVQEADFQEALKAYKGNFLHDCPEHAQNWVDVERQHLTTLLENLTEAFCGLLFSRSEYQFAATICHEALAHDQRMEAVHRCLMSAYAKSSKLNLVENQFRLLVKILEKECDTQPSAETSRLYQQIKRECV